MKRFTDAFIVISGGGSGIGRACAKKIAAEGGRAKLRVNLGSLYDSGAGFWEWTGSLTTPPCSGNVRWLLQKGTSGVSAAQCEAFREHVGGYPGNARPTQPLNGRTVLSFDPTRS